MFGSARAFPVTAVCTLSLFACSLETPGRSEPGEPGGHGFDAGALIDAGAAAPPLGDAASGLDAGSDAAAPPLASDAGVSDGASQGDAWPLPDALVPPLDGAPDASDPTDAEAGAPPVDGAIEPDAGSCVLDGTFSVEVLFDVQWNGTTLAGIVPLLKAGTGQIRIVARLDLRGGGLRSRALVSTCGAIMPDFTAGNALVGTETYAGFFPDDSWDRPSMPRWDLGWEVGCADPGCSIATELLVATIGARSAAGDVWPGRKGPISNIVPIDHDSDGDPAVTIGSRGPDEHNAAGVPYKMIPVTWTLTSRAWRAFVPLRVTGEFHGKVDSCDAFSGVVTSGSVEARCVGCEARVEGQSRTSACSQDEATFLDENLPDWSVSGGTWRARRVPSDANCAVLRAAFEH